MPPLAGGRRVHRAGVDQSDSRRACRLRGRRETASLAALQQVRGKRECRTKACPARKRGGRLRGGQARRPRRSTTHMITDFLREWYEPLESFGRGGEGVVIQARDHFHLRHGEIKVRLVWN